MSGPRFTLAEFPNDAADQFERILHRLRRHGVGCAHLEHQPVGTVCVIHPQLVRCITCQADHVATHTSDDEFGCDICGDRIDHHPGDDLALYLTAPYEIDTTVSIGRGRRAAVGVVWLVGWGACPRCAPMMQTWGTR